MTFDQIDRIKRQYTDQYVSVDHAPPELARFNGLVGRVKTVNMSGRALVEWMNYHDNIGWYDIDIDHLKIVEKPLEPEPATKAKPAAKAKPAKPGAKKAAGGGLSPLEMLRQQGGKKPAKPQSAKPQSAKPSSAKPTGGKLSPLEQLRQQGGTKPKKTPPPEQKESTADEKAATQPQDKPAEGKPSTAEILAKLRQQKGKS